MSKKYFSHGIATTLTEEKIREFIMSSNQMAAKGLRSTFTTLPLSINRPSALVLAMATGSSLDDLVFVGMVGIIDPERPNVEKAILQLKAGGVLVKMITGDAEKTAKAIGKFHETLAMPFIVLPSYFSIAFEDLHHYGSGHLWRRSRSHERR